MADPTPPFGATVARLRGHVPQLAIGEATRPTSAQVEDYLGTVSKWVAARLGDYVTALAEADRRRIEETAATVVELGAAAMTWDRHNPQSAGGGYGAVLWEQYRTELDDLVALADELGADVVDENELDAGEPAWFFPPAQFSTEPQRQPW